MSNSPLVNYTRISPNKNSPRNHEIDTITIHCIVGQLSAESMGDWFAKESTQASSNYCVDKDGRIGLFVDEGDRSWCTSSRANDHRAITIEVACDKTHPYTVNDKAYNALINLVYDICKRNNIKRLLWKNDKDLIGQVDKQNMTIHRWFSNTACPGQWLFQHHFDIANKVNALLIKDEEPKPLYRVQVGAYSFLTNARYKQKELKKAGFDTYMVKASDGLYKVQTGAYEIYDNAYAQTEKLRKAGFSSFITAKSGEPVADDKTVNNKTLDEIAWEVINGDWGNYPERKTRLEAAGYNYAEVQKRVNELV